MAELKACVNCGKDFVGHNKTLRCPDCTPRADFKNECKICGELFYPSRYAGRRQAICDACKWTEGAKPTSYTYTCKACGKEYDTAYKDRDVYCSRECSFNDDDAAWREKLMEDRVSLIRNGGHIRRARRFGVKYERINIVDVFKRDGWICYLCGVETPKELRGTHEDNAPELDHVIPLSRGGTHTKDNVRCSCRKHNMLKGSMTEAEFIASRAGRRGGVNRYHRRDVDRLGGSAPATMILDIGG